jgi:hypothetical protein
MSQATTWGLQTAGPANMSEITARGNGMMDALMTAHRGASRPAYLTEGLWVNDGANPVWVLNYFDGSDDIEIGRFDTTTNAFRARDINPRADVASATTTDIGAAASQYVRITGTTTITGLGTAAAGVVRDVLFGGALTLMHDATSLILPGGANITTAAGDTALFRSEGSGNWRCVRYSPVGLRPSFAVRGTAKAWANLNGTGTIALRDSHNVSSVTDIGAGDYGFNFTSAMTATTYSVVATAGTSGARRTAETLGAGSQSPTTYRVFTTDLSGTVGDSDLVSSGIDGDLA